MARLYSRMRVLPGCCSANRSTSGLRALVDESRLSTMSTWVIRVAGALLLASWFRMSDGNAFWAGVFPALLTCGATLVAIWHVLIAPRR
jgi:hypothetical protein